MFCQKCGKEILDEAVVCVHCGCAVNNKAVKKASGDDTLNIGLAILSVLIPLFGVIYGAVKYKELPNSAPKYIACGIGGFVLNLLILFCL